MLRHIVAGLIVAGLILLQFSSNFFSFKVAGVLSLGCLITLQLANVFLGRENVRRGSLQFNMFTIVCLGLFCYHAMHDLVSRALASDIKQSIVDSMGDLFIAAGLAYFGFVHKASDQFQRWFAVCVSLGAYSAVNLLGYKLGFKSILATEENITAIGNVTAERMLAPFSSGVNSFGTVCSLGLCLALFTGRHAYNQRQALMLWISGAVFVVNLVCVYLVQIRSALIALLFSFLLLYLQERKKKTNSSSSLPVAVAWSSVVVLVALPMAFYKLAAVSFIDAVVPTRAYELIGRHSQDFSFLGGRAFIWDSAWGLLQQGEVGILGQGIERRDSSTVLGDFLGTELPTRTSYHNGFVEFTMVYGAVAAVVLIVVLGMTIGSIKRSIEASSNENERKTHQLRLAMLVACVAISFLEAFSASPFFWGTFLCLVFAPMWNSSTPRQAARAA